ncbi:MAG: hypothetical protein ACI95S_000226 [Dinoroseobacter sp.]|jgi:hypothetical protein
MGRPPQPAPIPEGIRIASRSLRDAQALKLARIPAILGRVFCSAVGMIIKPMIASIRVGAARASQHSLREIIHGQFAPQGRFFEINTQRCGHPVQQGCVAF